MPVVSKETLKGYFEDGKVPNEDDYIDLIDSMADMSKADYDSNDDGTVDSADNADTVDGQHASAFAPSGYGLGGPAEDISNQNLDNYLSSGFYRGINVTNAPSANWHYIIVVGHSNASWVTQIAYFYFERDIFYRQKDTGVWTAWEQIFPAQWDDIEEKPSTFSPSSHTHVGTDITSVVDNADKLDNIHASGFYQVNQEIVTSLDIKSANGISAGDTTINPSTGQIVYTESLRSRKGSTSYPVYAPKIQLTAIALSSPYNAGVGLSTQSNTFMDMSSLSSLSQLQYAKAYNLMVSVRDSGSAGTDCYVSFKTSSGASPIAYVGASAINNRWHRCVRFVPCGTNGDLWFDVVASGTQTLDVVIKVSAYYI
jgi:hypothetical protein